MCSTQSNQASSVEVARESMSYLTPGTNIFPRSLAGEILGHVGRVGEYGGVADGITPFLIGVAVRRLVRNYTAGDEWMIEFLKGLFFNPYTAIQATIHVHVTPEDRSLAQAVPQSDDDV